MDPDRPCSIHVVLVSGRGGPIVPPPGRVFLVGPDHTLGDLARAIDRSFGRWDVNHPHEFHFSDGTRFGTTDLDDEGDVIDDDVVLVNEVIGMGEEFDYLFDLGDPWRHRCRLDDVRVEADDAPDREVDVELPAAIFGWGALPDQYGRATDDRV